MRRTIEQIAQKLRLPENGTWGKRSLATFSVTTYLLGITFGIAFMLAFTSEFFSSFGFFIISLSLYFFTEFLFTTVFHPTETTFDSFLLNHSTQFTIAMLASVLEYSIEAYFFPSLKTTWLLFLPGFILTFTGQIIRILALWTLGRSFTHLVADTKKEEHVMVDWGIVKYIRHPGYCGWYWWSIGSQLMIGNPICTAGFAFASYHFFKDRIEEEEEILIQKIFPGKYEHFRDITPTFIPFIDNNGIFIHKVARPKIAHKE